MKSILKGPFAILTILLAFCISCQPKSDLVNTQVDIGSHKLQFNIIHGNGIPIVFESGAGNDGSVWTKLVNSLYSEIGSTLITYDRAGYGNSELNPNLNNIEKGNILNTVKDLEAALKVLNINKEIIIVAHSYGGFTAALFSERNPDLVKGIVLIDANIKCFFTDEIRLKYKNMGSDSLFNVLKEEYDIGLYHESVAFDESLKVILKTSFPSEIPIVDLVAENPSPAFEETVEKWISCHEEFGSVNKKRKSYIAKNCGHYIFLDDPKYVIQKIVDIYNQVQIEK